MRVFDFVVLVAVMALLAPMPAGAQCNLYTDAFDSIDPAPMGSVVTYTVTVGNLGPAESGAQEIVNIELPPGVGPNLADYLRGEPNAVAAFAALEASLSFDPQIWDAADSDYYLGEDASCEAIHIQAQDLVLPPGAQGNIYYSVPMPAEAHEKIFRFDSPSLNLDLVLNSGFGGCSANAEDCTGVPCMGPRLGAIPLVSGELELVDDGAGGSLGCTPPVGFTPGKVALIGRGDCAFELKAALAVNPDGDPTTEDGASAVIIADHDDFTDSTVDPYDIINMACTDFCSIQIITVPTMFISWADGQDIHAAMNAGETVIATMGLQESNGLLTSTGYVWEFGGASSDSDDSNDIYVETTLIADYANAPVADIDTVPEEIWPGDLMTVVDESQGWVDRRALWVTAGPNPEDPVVAGTTTLAADVPAVLAFTVPLNLSQDQDFYAHVAVENDDHPYLGDATPDQHASMLIDVDREPQVHIQMAPEFPLTGETVTFTALYEGNPSHPASGPEIQWTVVGPDPPPITDVGATIVVDLSFSGTWIVDVAVYYRHEAVDGSRYVATSQYQVTVSSVVAVLSFDQAPLVSTQPVAVNGTQSQIGPGAMPSYLWEISGATTYTGCPSGPFAVQCIIPADALNPGLHDFQLTLTNTANGDVSISRVEDEPVVDGTIALDFSWSPAVPKIGEPVTFSLSGVPDAVDGAVWNLGGGHCAGGGVTDPALCSLPDEHGCTELVHRYAVAGPHVVSVSIENADISYGPVEHSISVVDEGSCLHGAPSMWEMVADEGLGVPGNTALRSMAVLAGQLIVGTENEMDGCEVWRSVDGDLWEQIATAGIADPGNSAAQAMEVNAGTLFVGTGNSAAGGEVRRFAPASGWSAAAAGGFGDPENVAVEALAVHEGFLYAGTNNPATGGQVWRMATDGSWTQVGSSGMGSADNDRITALQAFDDELYAASTGYWGFRLWRFAPPASWLQVGFDGFGDNLNLGVSDLAEVFDTLILGTENHSSGTELWQSGSGDSWIQVNLDGFGEQSINEIATFVTPYADEAYVGTSNWQSGSQVWRSDEVLGWVQTNWDGFGDQYNILTPGKADFRGALYVGTENPFGCQIWRLNTTTLFADGFEAGTTGAWQETLN